MGEPLAEGVPDPPTEVSQPTTTADPLPADLTAEQPVVEPTAEPPVVEPTAEPTTTDPLPAEPPVVEPPVIEPTTEPPAPGVTEPALGIEPAEAVATPAEAPTVSLEALYRDILAALDRGDEAALGSGCRALVAHVVSMAESVRRAYDTVAAAAGSPLDPVDPETQELERWRAENDALEAEIRALETDIHHIWLAVQATEEDTARLNAAAPP